MTDVQFWLLCAAIYDAAYGVKTGGKHFVFTVAICMFMAILSSPITQAYLEGLLS